MLEVCLLGTGGTLPLPGRALTALMVRYNGSSILIDCGEGTQVAVKERGWSLNPIDMILFTHVHADHIAGLPGLLLTMAKQNRTEPVRLIGPRALTRYVQSLLVIAPELPYEIQIIEIEHPEQVFSLGGLQIEAFAVEHSIPCYGYSLHLPRAGRFHVEKALAAGIEKKYWSRLQKGETVDVDGKVYTPNLVLGEARKGIRVTYCTDTRPVASIARHAAGSDLFICEGMYGSDEQRDNAIEKKHMLYREAAEMARKANVKELWLTHYSPSMYDPQEYMDLVREIFPHAVAPEQQKSVTLTFETEDKK